MGFIPCSHIFLLLTEQLDEDSSALQGADPAQDIVLMVEAGEKFTHVWSHKICTALFPSAMRRFAQSLELPGWRVHYRALDAENDRTLAKGLTAVITRYQPSRIIGVEPGDMGARHAIDFAIESIAISAHNQRATSIKPIMEWCEDKHFLCSLTQFLNWAALSASLRMHFFYRNLRQQHRVGDPRTSMTVKNLQRLTLGDRQLTRLHFGRSRRAVVVIVMPEIIYSYQTAVIKTRCRPQMLHCNRILAMRNLRVTTQLPKNMEAQYV